MKQDTINKIITFFNARDKGLLDNPAKLKAEFLDAYGNEYQPEITVFCQICTRYIQKKIVNPDKNYIIYLGKIISNDLKINEKAAVLLFSCYVYIKKLISFDVLKELIVYKPEENIGSNSQQHSNQNQINSEQNDQVNEEFENAIINPKMVSKVKSILKNPNALVLIGLLCGIFSLIACFALNIPFSICFFLSIIVINISKYFKALGKKHIRESKIFFLFGVITSIVIILREIYVYIFLK